MAASAISQPSDAALYDAVTIIWILLFVVERVIIRSRGAKRAEIRSDRGSALLIVVSIFVSVTIPNFFATLNITPLPGGSFYAGLIMMVLGIAVRIWAVTTMRSSYTVQIKEGHRIISSGPCRFVRHPAYSGSLLTILGVGFALQSWGAVTLMALVFGVAFGYRIRVEEKALIRCLGTIT